jgi:hypothetical protein
MCVIGTHVSVLKELLVALLAAVEDKLLDVLCLPLLGLDALALLLLHELSLCWFEGVRSFADDIFEAGVQVQEVLLHER